MGKETMEDIKWLADSMIDNFPGCILRVAYTDESMSLEYVSDGIFNIIGFTPEEYKENFNRITEEYINREDLFWDKKYLKEFFKEGKALRKEYALREKNGRVHWIEVRGSMVEQTEEKIVMQYILLDIDEQKRAEELAKKEHERLEVVAGLSTDSLFEYDIAADRMQYYNEKEILIDFFRNKPTVEHYTERILDGSILDELFHPEDRHKLQEMCQAFRDGKPEIYAEVRKQYEIGKYTWVSLEARTMYDKQGTPTHVIGKISNIDERIKREQEMKYQLERDQLTGLYNKQTVESLIIQKMTNGIGQMACLVLTDVDDFKLINDAMGHLFGDGVLCTFANYLQELFPEAIIGRCGGDEFIFYLEGMSSEDVQNRITRINRRLARIHAGENDELKISASFGFVKCEEGKEYQLEDLKYKADIALCFLKQNSKGMAILYEPFMDAKHIHKEKKELMTVDGHKAREAVIHTEGDLMLFAHELFDNIKDIRGALRLLCDVITRFYHFQDILYVHKLSDSEYELMFHWGENNTDQFVHRMIDVEAEQDWKKLFFTEEEKESFVMLEDDFTGENINQVKSMLSFAVREEGGNGYCILADRHEKRNWNEELPMLLKLGDFAVKRYMKLLQKMRAEEEAEYKSKYDHLTGLMNYSYFMAAAEQYIRTHQEQQLAVLYTDFTNFKFLNETYGYSEGNQILKEYAEFLKDEPGLMHARISADSFVSLYVVDDVEQMQENFTVRAEQFCEKAHQYYDRCKLGITGGIELVDTNQESISLNVDNANMARKSLRKDGTVQVTVYTAEMRKEQQRQMEIVSSMSEALENKEFRVYLQPKMDMFTDKVIGAEALVRWFKPDGSMVSPGEFIPIFEENGFVTQLDFEMMRQVLDMQQKRLKEGKPLVKISVNFSRKHQEDQTYLKRLDELMGQFDVPAEALEIEITESVFMQDLAPLTDSISQLKQRGFSVSIDDFGAGYSSLNVLSKIKADIVKLDRQFLLDVEMEKDNFTSEFLQLLINMIKQLGFKVLAEGVETEEQVALLKNAGCRFAQGFYYARPMPVEEFLAFIDQHMIQE